MIRIACLALALAVSSVGIANAAESTVQYEGVNLPEAASGADSIPGKYGTNYIYPQPSTLDYFAKEGMNIIRLPVLWERLQHRLLGNLDNDEMGRVDAVVSHAESKRMRVILDVHNYAAYSGTIIGTKGLPPSALGDLWRRIAQRYKDNETVIFGLMNEPNSLPTETWLEAANIAIADIRRTGAKILFLCQAMAGRPLVSG